MWSTGDISHSFALDWPEDVKNALVFLLGTVGLEEEMSLFLSYLAELSLSKP